MSDRRLVVLTTGRQDYGILRSTILLLRRTPGFQTALWAGGMHLQRRFGEPLEAPKRDGVPVARELAFLSEPPDAMADAGAAVGRIGAALLEDAPDALLLVGDRTEALAAGLAATIAKVPVVHLHGGEESEGAIDNACRHALTKLSHLHLVSHQTHADRVIQMGEDPATVVVVGPPALDQAYRDDLPSADALAKDLGVALRPPVVLVTMHPATLGAPAGEEVAAVAAAMAQVPATYVITAPNADEGGVLIGDYWRRWAGGRESVALIDALGDRRYWALMRVTDAVLGNSSSGIIEAPSLGVPAVNVGDRQRGRLRFGPVTDVPAAEGAVATALRGAIAAGRRPSGGGSAAPAETAASRIVAALGRWEIPRPPRKRFRDVG